MSGPTAPPATCAVNANQLPSGEYAADWPMTTTSFAIANRFAVSVGVALGRTGLPLGDGGTTVGDAGDSDPLSLGVGEGVVVTTALPSTFATKTLEDEVPFSRPTTTSCFSVGDVQMLFAVTGTTTTVALLSIGAQSVEPVGQTVPMGLDVTIRVDPDSCGVDSAQTMGPMLFTWIGVGPGVPAETAALGKRLGMIPI